MKINHALKHMLLAASIGLISLCFLAVGNHAYAMPQMKPVFDLSNWQGTFSNSQAQGLKNESSFEILKAQEGTTQDAVFAHNKAVLSQNGVPFGIYSFSHYKTPAEARSEARSLYYQDRKAKFFVNDLEGYYPSDAATIAWANEMHALTNRPVVLYSSTSYLDNYVGSAARNAYDTLWVASYGNDYSHNTYNEPDPSYHYDLWQYTDQYPSASLGENVDASTIPDQGKSISYWIGDSHHNSGSKTNYNHAKPWSKRKYHKNWAKIKVVKTKQPKAKKSNPYANYYTSNQIKRVRVISSGINLYYHGIKVNHFKRGAILKVKYFKRLKTMTRAVNKYGYTFTSNKKCVKAIG